MKEDKFEAEDIYLLLKERFSDSRQWLCASEVSNTTGGGSRRLDYVAANCYPSEGFGIHAFEVKISKSDLRRELTTPDKHNLFFEDIDYYSIVAPDYVLDKEYCEIVPKNWGIYKAYSGHGLGPNTLKAYRKPLALHDERDRKIRRGFAFSMIRAMGTCAAFKDRNKLNEMLRASFQEGVVKGRCNAAGVDYEKLYKEVNEKFIKCMDILRIFGMSYYGMSSGGAKEEAERLQKENETNKKIANAVRRLKYRADELKEVSNEYERVVAPVIGTLSDTCES